MSDSQSFNTVLLKIMISYKNEHVFICDLNDCTLQILFDAWWASMNIGSKCPIAWNSLRHAPSWRFDVHCVIEETISPGIICIVCQHVLRHLSEHGTSSMGKYLLTKADIAKLNKLTESEVTTLTSSTGDQTALAILKRQGSCGIQTVSSQRKFTFDFRFYSYWQNWQAKCSKLAVKYFDTAEFHQDTWNCYLMLGFVSAHIPWKAISNLALQQPYNPVRSELVLPSASTLGNICGREYTPTVDAIQKQLLSRNIVSLPLDGCTSTIKLAITLVIAYYMDRNWAPHEVQLAFDEVDCQFVSLVES